MKHRFRNKVAVITGAGSGIGRAMALALATREGHLALCDKNSKTLNETVGLLGRHSTEVLASQLDVSDEAAVAVFAGQVKDKFGQIELLINSAGVNIAAKPFTEISPEEWKWLIDTNLWGTINVTRTFLSMMSKGATVVTLSSMLGLGGMINQTAYSTTKFALRGLMESLAMELADEDIHVVTVFPGAVRTNFIDNSWADDENKALIKSYIKKMGSISVEKVVSAILTAVSKRKARAVIGKDARGLDLLARLLPNKYVKIVLSQIKKRL